MKLKSLCVHNVQNYLRARKVSLLHNKALCKAFLNTLNSAQLAQLQSILVQNISDVGGSSPGRMEGLKKNMSEGNFNETLIDLLPVQRCYRARVSVSDDGVNVMQMV